MKIAYKLLSALLAVAVLVTSCKEDDPVLSTEADLISFAFTSPAVTGNIAGSNVTVVVPFGTDVTSLAPTIEVSPKATVSPASGVAQNFTNPVVYTVTAEDGTTSNEYTVTVTTLPNTEKAISGVTFEGVTAEVAISGTSVTATVPWGTDVTTLVPTFTLSANATIDPAGGVATDFTDPQTYTVTAQDQSTAEWTVTVVIAAPDNLSIVGFAPSKYRTVTIDQEAKTITVDVVKGSVDVAALAATITTDPVSNLFTLDPASGAAADYSSPKTISVSYGGTTVEYTVTVNVLVTGFDVNSLTVVMDKSASPGPLPVEFATNFTERGFDMNSAYAYVADRSAPTLTNTIVAYSLADGSSATPIELSNTGLDGSNATHIISKIQATDNGILACNLAIGDPTKDPQTTQTFRVYRWADNTSNPELLLSYVSTYRLGDTFNFEGDPQGDGVLYVGTNGADIGTSQYFLKWTMTGGVIDSPDNPEILTLAGLSGNIGSYASLDQITVEGVDYLLVDANIPPTLFSADGSTQLGQINGGVIAASYRDALYFEFNGSQYLATANYVNVNKFMVYDITGADLGATFGSLHSGRLMFEVDLGTNSNSIAAMDVDIYIDEATSELYVLGASSNNGLKVVKLSLNQ